ncbi:MAG: DUF5071 domain-containing protein [Candidatus Competibacter denitrificans]
MPSVDLTTIVPLTKFDIENAYRLVSLGFPGTASVLPAILEWTQDLNWPVARVFAPFLATIGPPISEQIRAVLCGDDESWKYSLLAGVVAESPTLAQSLHAELARFSTAPTATERGEGIDQVAMQILEGLGRESEA